MKRFHYNLESYDGDEDEDEFGNCIPIDVALQNEAHATNIMVREWIEALTLGEVGQDQIFAPNHTFGSFHGDETEVDVRETAYHAWFYQTCLFLMDVDQIGPADYDVYVECRMTAGASIITRFIGLSTPTEMSSEAQDEIYDRVLRAATAHAEGRGAIFFFDNPELAGAGGEAH